MKSALAALALALGACGDVPDASPTLTVRAVFVQPMYAGQAALVRHEAIPDRMPAMRMALSLATPDLVDDLAKGAPVTLTLDSTSLRVVAVAPLPAGTPLDLDPDPASGVWAPPEE